MHRGSILLGVKVCNGVDNVYISGLQTISADEDNHEFICSSTTTKGTVSWRNQDKEKSQSTVRWSNDDGRFSVNTGTATQAGAGKYFLLSDDRGNYTLFIGEEDDTKCIGEEARNREDYRVIQSSASSSPDDTSSSD